MVPPSSLIFRVTTHDPKKVNVKISVKCGPLPVVSPCNSLKCRSGVWVVSEKEKGD